MHELHKLIADAWGEGAARSDPIQGWMSLQRACIEEMSALWRCAEADNDGSAARASIQPKADPRFKSTEWQAPYYDVLRQSYLAGSALLHSLVDCVSADERTRRQLHFMMRQYTDAISPANFLATNPKAWQLALDTEGESVATGFVNLLTDLGRGRISTTGEAFEVGGNIAATPGAVVFENELIQLIQYSPVTAKVDERPLLVVPPCINKFYVLDLQAENSFARYAVSEGNTVFMVSWRSATEEIEHLTWDDYLRLGVLAAVDAVRDITDGQPVHGLGFCIGGTLLGCAAAVLAAHGESKFASLTLLTTMLDFSDTGEIGLLVDDAYVRTREAMIGEGGLLYGRELAVTFSILRANDLVWPYVVSNYLNGESPQAFDILFWNEDSTNLPGPMYCWYLRHAYLENRIRTPGGTVQCGVPLDLSKVDAPTYVLAASEDHIVPWRSAYATTHVVGGESRFVLGASGHIAGVINPAARNKRSFWADGRQGADPDEWLASAREVPGSWWTDWSRWLKRHGGAAVPARHELGSARYRSIEPAPGRYARAPAE